MPANTANRRSIVVIVGLLMAAVVGLGVASMVGSMVIAQINRGMASAVNQSGTLRMQSYRIATALTDTALPLAERQARAARLAEEYEQRITSARLTDALPRAANDPVRLAYERVRWRWVHDMRRAVADFADAPDPAGVAAGRAAYLAQVDDFVADIHGLVRVLEERAEQRIELLRWMQIVALVLTVIAVLVTLVVVQRRVVSPLAELLRCADRVRQGDFSARAGVAGGDELGRLGAAMNLMTDGLSRIYEELEERVAAKTRDLARTNHSLELLYRTSRTLDEAPISRDLLHRVLVDVRAQLGLAEVVLCLRDGRGFAGCGCIAAAGPDAAPPPTVQRSADCTLCAGPRLAEAPSATPTGAPGPPRLLDLPVGDAERRYGLLRVLPAPGRRLESWQRPLLESLAAHFATALALQDRMRESRRLVLHEERSILARELHDSLAQSLSYLNIQAARLDAALRAAGPALAPAAAQAAKPPAAAPIATPAGPPDAPARSAAALPLPADGRRPPAAPAQILAEMRTGIASAYRQLRELLTTFRLRMDGAGLGSALAATVREFEARGALLIRLRDRLPAGLLTANEEVHVLQIVREALSNVVRHAHARTCRVMLGRVPGGRAGAACVVISDDGVGHPAATGGTRAQAQADHAAAFHHGSTIMRERAQSLGGSLTIEPRAGGGTRVVLRFLPRALQQTVADAADGQVMRAAAASPDATTIARGDSAAAAGATAQRRPSGREHA
jgi:two-component system nitrate/nitrite sensor histidine kinase NarX